MDYRRHQSTHGRSGHRRNELSPSSLRTIYTTSSRPTFTSGPSGPSERSSHKGRKYHFRRDLPYLSGDSSDDYWSGDSSSDDSSPPRTPRDRSRARIKSRSTSPILIGDRSPRSIRSALRVNPGPASPPRERRIHSPHRLSIHHHAPRERGRREERDPCIISDKEPVLRREPRDGYSKYDDPRYIPDRPRNDRKEKRHDRRGAKSMLTEDVRYISGSGFYSRR